LMTKYAGHARELARTLDFTGFDALCAMGGDGTLQEIVDGMLHREDQKQLPVGLVPAGSGNSVCSDLGCATPTEAARRIASGDTVAVDAIRVRDEGKLDVYSVNVVAFCLVAHAGALSEGWRWLGVKRYDICGMWSILKYPKKPFEFGVNGQTPKKANYYLLFACQTQHLGKGSRALPLAKVDDGLVDILVLNCDKPMNRAKALRIFQQVPTGAHLRSNPDLESLQVKSFSIKSENEWDIMNLDGENYRYEGRVTLEVVHHAFRMFIPPNCSGEPC